MLRDECGRPWIPGESGDAARPHGLTDTGGRTNEIKDLARRRIDPWRGILFGPAVIVLTHGVENLDLARICCQRHAALHHVAREMGVIGLRDQLESFTGVPNDHWLLRTAFCSGALPRTMTCVTFPCASLTNSKPAGVVVDMNFVSEVGIRGTFGSFKPRT